MKAAPARELALDITERIDGLEPIEVRRFFGGMGLRSGGTLFAFVMKGSLYLRVDERMRANLEALGGTPFVYPGASGLVTVANYCEAPANLLEDDCALSQWASKALSAATSEKPGQGRGRRSTQPHSGPPRTTRFDHTGNGT